MLKLSKEERNMWWGGLIARLTKEVILRGGSVNKSDTFVEFYAPAVGEDFTIFKLPGGSNDKYEGAYYDWNDCDLVGGYFFKYSGSYVNYEKNEYSVLKYALAIISGQAKEVISVSTDGTWEGEYSYIESEYDASYLDDAQKRLNKNLYTRTIPAWRKIA